MLNSCSFYLIKEHVYWDSFPLFKKSSTEDMFIYFRQKKGVGKREEKIHVREKSSGPGWGMELQPRSELTRMNRTLSVRRATLRPPGRRRSGYFWKTYCSIKKSSFQLKGKEWKNIAIKPPNSSSSLWNIHCWPVRWSFQVTFYKVYKILTLKEVLRGWRAV